MTEEPNDPAPDDESAFEDAPGFVVHSFDDFVTSDGGLDPLTLYPTPEEGIALAADMLLTVNPWGSDDRRKYEAEIANAIRFGVSRGAKVTGQALAIAYQNGQVSREAIEPVFKVASTFPMFRVAFGRNPPVEGDTLPTCEEPHDSATAYMTDMTMTQIAQREAARRRNGEFGAHIHTAPETSLGQAPARTRNPDHVGASVEDGDRVLYVAEYIHGFKTQLTPRGLTETRRALINRRGETDRGIREVHLDWDSVPPGSDATLEVHGPKDGRPLIINVHAGCPRMDIASGNVIVKAGGNGFSINVKDEARAKVIGVPGHKVSVTAEAGSIVDFYAEEGSRGYQRIEDDAIFRLHGESADITLSSDVR